MYRNKKNRLWQVRSALRGGGGVESIKYKVSNVKYQI